MAIVQIPLFRRPLPSAEPWYALTSHRHAMTLCVWRALCPPLFVEEESHGSTTTRRDTRCPPSENTARASRPVEERAADMAQAGDGCRGRDRADACGMGPRVTRLQAALGRV